MHRECIFAHFSQLGHLKVWGDIKEKMEFDPEINQLWDAMCNFKMAHPKREKVKSLHVGFFKEPYLLQISRKLIGCEVSFPYIR